MNTVYNIKGHDIKQKSDGWMMIDDKVTLFNSSGLHRIFGDVYGEAEKSLVQEVFPKATFTTEFSGDGEPGEDTHYTVSIQL